MPQPVPDRWTHASGPRGNLALYRRYRSATFAEVIGQEHVTEPLSIALSAGRVNHAYLFSGPRGCGKTSSARILARSLNCAQGPTPTPCGVCNSCRELAPNGPGSIDVIEIDAASHNGVDDARDLRERAYYSPARDRYKVYIIDEAHMVTSHAFNALLKVVEEPPDHLVFIFATTEPDKVLQTIRSRTHHYPFRLVAPSVLRAHLENIAAAEGVSVEPAVYPLVVRAGAGSVRDALSLLDQLFAGADDAGVTYQRAVALLGVTDAALIDDMIDALAVSDGASVYATVDKVIEAGHEPRRFATDLLDRLRDLLILDAVPDAAEKGLLDAPVDALERMRDQAARIGATAAARYAETVHTALIEMRGTTAPRLLLELVCARMLLPDASTDSAALLQRLDRIERLQRLTGGAGAAVVERVAPDHSSPAPATAAHAPATAAAARPAAAAEPAQAAAAAAPAPAAALAATDVVGAIDVTQVRALWPEVLDAVRASSRRTRALLDSAQVAGIEGNNLRLVMATAPLVKMLGEPRNADVVTAALGDLLPGPWTMQVDVGTDGTAAPALPVAAQTLSPPPAAATTPEPPGLAPTDPVPTDSAPVDSAPVESAPVDAAPVDPAPVDPAPVDPAPTDPVLSAPLLTDPKPGEPASPALAAPEPAPDVESGGWPTVASIPTGRVPDNAQAPSPARGRNQAAEPSSPRPDRARRGTSRSKPAFEAIPDPEEPADPEEYDEPGESVDGLTAARHDPETQALDLLRSGLGAQSVD